MVSQARWLLLCVSLAAAGCACPGPPPGGQPDGGGDPLACDEDRDCPDLDLYFCDLASNRCAPSCRTREECREAHRGEHAVPACDVGLGCQCDDGRCVPTVCSADADCPGQVCRSGACVAQPAQATACRLFPEYALARTGAALRFSVLVDDSAGGSAAPGQVGWTLLAGLSGAPSGAVAEVVAASPTARTVGLRAETGGVSCTAEVEILPAAASGTVRVIATDELSGRGVQGAVLHLSDPDTGALLSASSPSAANGVVEVTLPGGTPVGTISVFHPGYGYLTLARWDLTGGGADLAVGLRRNPIDRYGGYQGTFTGVPQTGHLHAGAAGLSFKGDLLELSVEQVIGQTVPTDIRIGATVDQKGVPLPAGVFLSLGTDQPMKTQYAAQGPASTCEAFAAEPDAEAAILAGRCGSGAAWALAGDVPINDLPLDLLVSPTGTVDLSALLSRTIPLFKKFNSSVRRDLSWALRDTPGVESGTPSFSDQAHFQRVDHPFAQLPLAFNFAARLPALPKFRGQFLESAAVLGGAQVPGRGFVPLGIGVGANENGNDRTDLQSGLPAEGLLTVRMAPTHHGLEGAPYRLLAVAGSNRGFNDASLGPSGSALLLWLRPNRLSFDPTGTAPVAFNGPFPPPPDLARYNPGPQARPGLPPRGFAFAGDPGLSGESLVRVVFADRAARRWTVVLTPEELTNGFVLPAPPSGLADRTYRGELPARRSSFTVQSLRLDADPLAPVPGNLVAGRRLFDAADYPHPRWSDHLTAASLATFPGPRLSWRTPSADDQVVAPGGELMVQVAGLQVGVEGGVQFSYSGGTGCGQTQLVTTDASQGRGEITTQLPAGCVGDAITVTAELYEGDPPSAPLQPAVSAAVRLNVR